MKFNRCGRGGLMLPAISLGLWQNFGGDGDPGMKRAMCRKAFDLGITHFDLANNYGPPPGAAEQAFGEILRGDFSTHRDEIVVSTKAGYPMWEGPYGDGGSRKYLLASLDRSLKRLGLDYVDIFYSHRPDPSTPLEETMGALDHAVRSGRALYAGISNYGAERLRAAAQILRALGTPCLIHQPRYSMFDRAPETGGVLEAAADEGMGTIVFSPLAQGLLTSRYLQGVPPDSRASRNQTLRRADIDAATVARLRQLARIAEGRGQSLAQLALAWVLRGGHVTSALIGASRPEQIEECVGALSLSDFAAEELQEIDRLMPAGR
jgi:L-glyceraldehyde 3-phosphate reductase